MGENILLSTVFIAGFLSFFAPCTFPLIPVYIGFMVDELNEYKKVELGSFKINVGGIIKTIAFVLGLSTSFVILGFGAGWLGKFLNNSYIIVFAGILVFLLGIHQMDIIHFKKLDKIPNFNLKFNKNKALGVYLMGVSFSLGWTPCIGPILAAVLLASASQGTQLYGAFLMLIYSIGLMIPFILMALLSNLMIERLDFIKKHLITIKRFGGLMIAIMGIILMANQLSKLVALFNNLFI